MSLFQSSLKDAIQLFNSISYLEKPMAEAAEIVKDCLLNGGKLLTCGNGGSASDSAHLACEILCRFKDDRLPFPAISLNSDGCLLTANGNDYSFDELFARQIWGLGKPNDVLIVFTSSGKSKNILRALEEANRKNLSSIAFLGRDGGPAKGLATVDVIVNHSVTARIQEIHTFLLHVLCESIEKDLRAAKEPADIASTL